jgi:hypothetical protein
VKGETIVESIDVLRSVDLVAEPATNVGLFESKGARMRVRRKKSAGRSGQTAKQLLESIAANQPRRRKRSPMMQLIEGVFKKEKDPKRLKTRINKILDANNSDNDLVEDAPRRRTGTNKRDLMEARLQKEINALKHERRVRDLCEDKGLRPTAVQMKALLGMNSKKEVKELIESMKTRGNPRGGARSREGGEGHVKDVRTKDFLEDLGVLDLEEDDSED